MLAPSVRTGGQTPHLKREASGPDDSLDTLLSSYTPRQREKVLKGLRILARVAIRSYMEEEADASKESQAEDGGEEESR